MSTGRLPTVSVKEIISVLEHLGFQRRVSEERVMFAMLIPTDDEPQSQFMRAAISVADSYEKSSAI
jgi:hypothetical protein